MALDISGARQ